MFTLPPIFALAYQWTQGCIPSTQAMEGFYGTFYKNRKALNLY
jgi:hypothetical protein